MIDYFALALTHGLLLIALLRIAGRADVDHEDPVGAQAADDCAPEVAARENRTSGRSRGAKSRPAGGRRDA